jgi:hypothetical protein
VISTAGWRPKRSGAATLMVHVEDSARVPDVGTTQHWPTHVRTTKPRQQGQRQPVSQHLPVVGDHGRRAHRASALGLQTDPGLETPHRRVGSWGEPAHFPCEKTTVALFHPGGEAMDAIRAARQLGIFPSPSSSEKGSPIVGPCPPAFRPCTAPDFHPAQTAAGFLVVRASGRISVRALVRAPNPPRSAHSRPWRALKGHLPSARPILLRPQACGAPPRRSTLPRRSR